MAANSINNGTTNATLPIHVPFYSEELEDWTCPVCIHPRILGTRAGWVRHIRDHHNLKVTYKCTCGREHFYYSVLYRNGCSNHERIATAVIPSQPDTPIQPANPGARVSTPARHRSQQTQVQVNVSSATPITNYYTASTSAAHRSTSQPSATPLRRGRSASIDQNAYVMVTQQDPVPALEAIAEIVATPPPSPLTPPRQMRTPSPAPIAGNLLGPNPFDAPIEPEVVQTEPPSPGNENIPENTPEISNNAIHNTNAPPIPEVNARHRRPAAPNENQKSWIRRIDDAHQFIEFENVIVEWSNIIAPPRPPPPLRQQPRTTQRPAGPINANPIEARRIQEMYDRNKRKAMREVFGGQEIFYSGNNATTFDFFNDLQLANNPQAHDENTVPFCVPPPPPNVDNNDPLSTRFSPEEIFRKMKFARNSAPGEDGITNAMLKRADPNGHILCALFNRCRSEAKTPSLWKSSMTILIHKKGSMEDLNNWRPIALGRTMAKLYAAVLAGRISAWTKAHQRISSAQKGFTAAEGCLEHNFVLKSAIDDAKRNKKQIFVAWLDLSNAFGSIPHTHIARSLERIGLGANTRNIILELYDENSTKIRTSEGTTNPITVTKGVRQGCPASPAIFNICIEPMVQAIETANMGYWLAGHCTSVLVFADDMVLISQTQEGLQKALDAAGQSSDWAGLKFNSQKCASLHIDGKNRTAPTNHQFTIQNDQMRSMDANEAYKYLGVYVGFGLQPAGLDEIDTVRRELIAVDESMLKPWQKFDALKMFTLSKLGFALRNATVPRKPLNQLDRELKTKMKKWLNLPSRASAEPLYLANNIGGMGAFPVSLLSEICILVQASKMLNASDQSVADIAIHCLQEVAGKGNEIATTTQAARFLNGGNGNDISHNGGGLGTLWTRARTALPKVAKTTKIEWQPGRQHHQKMSLYVNNGPIFDKLEFQIKGAIRRKMAENLAAKPDQGKVFEVTSKNIVSNKFCRDGKFLRFCDWRFIHRARLNCVALNAVVRVQNPDKRCRRCNFRLETLPHVLNHCNTSWDLITKRHNRVVDRLVRAIPIGTAEIRLDQRAPEVASNLRPDIIIWDPQNKKATIIDVVCPFENRQQAFDAARLDKETKYQPLVNELVSKGFNVSLHALVVGALGAWDDKNNKLLIELGINRSFAMGMKDRMVTDAISESRNIYVRHVTPGPIVIRRNEP